MTYKVDALILRFRDLITALGETLSLHNEICIKEGYVWWGWWSKAGESVPAEVFIDLNALAKNEKSGIEIFLLDTSSSQVYSVRCKEIRFDNSGSEIESPKPVCTPKYYRRRKCLAWFKFIRIETTPIDESRLKSYSYVDVKEFYKSGDSFFSRFDGKVVMSARELRYQDRSIYFVRQTRKDDPAYEILIHDSTVFEPAHFPRRFFDYEGRGGEQRTTDLLWLSDLHFGNQAFPIKREGEKFPLARQLEAACRNLGLQVGGVIVSGDITWSASEDQFRQAEAFIGHLLSVLRLGRYDLMLCPGNHDFRFEEGKRLKKDEQIAMTSESSSSNYSDFYKKLFGLTPHEYFASGRRYLLGNAYPVELIALNSLRLQQTKGEFQGYGFVGNDQLDWAAEQYHWETKSDLQRPTRIIVLHHHLVPVTYSEATRAKSRYSISLDAEAITQWALRNNVDVVLHGHMHQPYCVQLRRPIEFGYADSPDPGEWPSLTVCGLGSSGVAIKDLGNSKKNTFGVLSFSADTLTISIYEIDPEKPTTHDHRGYCVKLPLRHGVTK